MRAQLLIVKLELTNSPEPNSTYDNVIATRPTGRSHTETRMGLLVSNFDRTLVVTCQQNCHILLRRLGRRPHNEEEPRIFYPAWDGGSKARYTPAGKNSTTRTSDQRPRHVVNDQKQTHARAWSSPTTACRTHRASGKTATKKLMLVQPGFEREPDCVTASARAMHGEPQPD